MNYTIRVSRPDGPPRPPDALAYELFRGYSKDVIAAGHPAPHIRDERRLVTDLHDALDKAQVAVKNNVHYHDNFEYLLGFGAGHVTGQLQVRWHADYVMPHDWRFKAKSALDGILGLTQLDEVLRVRLQNLYAHSLAKHETLVGLSPEVPIYTFNERAVPVIDGFSDEVSTLLENLRIYLIDDLVRRERREVELRDAGGGLERFIARWLSYAVSGMVFNDETGQGEQGWLGY